MTSTKTIATRVCFLDAAVAFQRTVKLYHHDRLPVQLERQMIVIPLKRMLRSIYGTRSNTWAILSLLFEHWGREISQKWYKIRYWRQIRKDAAGL